MSTKGPNAALRECEEMLRELELMQQSPDLIRVKRLAAREKHDVDLADAARGLSCHTSQTGQCTPERCPSPRLIRPPPKGTFACTARTTRYKKGGDLEMKRQTVLASSHSRDVKAPTNIRSAARSLVPEMRAQAEQSASRPGSSLALGPAAAPKRHAPITTTPATARKILAAGRIDL